MFDEELKDASSDQSLKDKIAEVAAKLKALNTEGTGVNSEKDKLKVSVADIKKFIEKQDKNKVDMQTVKNILGDLE